jgi:aminopeptidase N
LKFFLYIFQLVFFFSFDNSFASYIDSKLSQDQESLDIVFYNIDLKVDPKKKIISGNTIITFVLYQKVKNIEIDLLKNYTVSGTSINGTSLAFEQKNDKVYILNTGLKLFKEHSLEIKYVGKPPVSKSPPWEAGIIWDEDSNGNHWVGIACQSKGGHIWFPSKSNPNDKAEGAEIKITVPKPLKVVSNGLLKSIEPSSGYWHTWVWETNYPISSYNINFTIGDFKEVKRTGYILDKPLKMIFYTLSNDTNKDIELLKSAEEYLSFYAGLFGQYPWIQEKFGIVQTPYWGMEHQTAIAYGNNHKKTNLGYDFLLFHEIGHEWWGNFLSVYDWADFWIHEGINTYAEALYIEKKYNLETSINFIKTNFESNIQNKKPIIAQPNSGIDVFTDNDVYYKGAYLLHTLRYIIGKEILIESLKEFLYIPKEHSNNQTTTSEFVTLIEMNSKKELSWFFDQYWNNAKLPILNIKENIIKNKKFIDIWWEDDGFKMPIVINYNSFDGLREKELELSNNPKKIVIPKSSELIIDPESWVLFEKKAYK